MKWGNRVTFEVSSANPDDTPVWVDLTSWVLHEPGVEVTFGRQDNLDQTQPASIQFTLRNDDDRFTYGNASSPYASWWGPGRKCRLRESYTSTVFDVFTGYLQVPQEDIPTSPTPSGTGRGQRVTVTAVDRLARLAAAPTFVSTLGAHILGSTGGAQLDGYWSLVDDGLSFPDLIGTRPAHIETVILGSYSGVPVVSPGGGTAPPGDDAAPLRLEAATNIGPQVVAGALAPEAPWTLSAGDVLTFAAWVNLDAPVSASSNALVLSLNTSDGLIELRAFDNVATAGTWRLTKPVGTLTGSVNSTLQSPTSRSCLIAMRIGFTPNVIDLWVDGDTYTGTLSGVLAGPLIIYQVLVAGVELVFFTGSVSHMQLYIGSSTAYTTTDFAAQRAIGLTGLERQTTGDRIRTIAAYAGIPLAEYTDTIDKGTAVMQAASLADKTPLEAMREAERTEQGLLYVDGSGRLCFKDRRSLYNV